MTFARLSLPSTRLELHSRRADLEVLQDDDSRALSPNKHRALEMFLQNCLTETTQGRVVWSRASLQRRDPNEADT